MVLGIYAVKGKFLVPNVAKAKAGFYVDVAPVRTISIGDFDGLVSAIEEVVNIGNPVIPTPSRESYRTPVASQAAGARSWKAFERKAVCFTVTRTESEDQLRESGRSDDGSWVDELSRVQKFPSHLSAHEIAAWIIERVRQRDDLK